MSSKQVLLEFKKNEFTRTQYRESANVRVNPCRECSATLFLV